MQPSNPATASPRDPSLPHRTPANQTCQRRLVAAVDDPVAVDVASPTAAHRGVLGGRHRTGAIGQDLAECGLVRSVDPAVAVAVAAHRHDQLVDAEAAGEVDAAIRALD